MRADDRNAETTCLIEMRFAVDRSDQALRLLISGIERTEVKPGCRSCSISRDVREPELVRYREVWGSEEAFRTHARSEDFQRVLVAMDSCCEKPAVTISTPSARSGLNYLQNLYGAPHEEADPV